jgi:hypothetical protein
MYPFGEKTEKKAVTFAQCIEELKAAQAIYDKAIAPPKKQDESKVSYLSGPLFTYDEPEDSMFVVDNPVTRRNKRKKSEARLVFVTELARIWQSAKLAMQADTNLAAAAELLAAWIEASPFTCGRIVNVMLFDVDVDAGTAYHAALKSYLDAAIGCVPKLTPLAGLQLDTFIDRITDALRRGFITIIDVGLPELCIITDDATVAVYRRLLGVLQTVRSQPRGMVLRWVSDRPRMQEPHEGDLEAFEPQLGELPYGRLDLSCLPTSTERDSAVNALIALAVHGETLQPLLHGGAQVIAPLSFQEWSATDNYLVGYEMVADLKGTVRPERTGRVAPGRGRWIESDPDMVSLSGNALRAAIVTMFGCAAIVDNTAKWSDAELIQLAVAYSRVPRTLMRRILNGVTIFREGDVPTGTALTNTSKGHTAACAHARKADIDLVLKTDNVPSPHIHYFNGTFDEGSPIGPPCAVGPHSYHTLLHEVGHMRYLRYGARADRHMAAYLAVKDAVTKLTPDGLSGAPLTAFQNWAGLARKFQAVAEQSYLTISQYEAIDLDEPNERKRRETLEAAWKAPDELEVEVRKAIDEAASAGVPDETLSVMRQQVNGMVSIQLAAQAMLFFKIMPKAFERVAYLVKYPTITEYSQQHIEEWFADTFAVFYNDPQLLCSISWPMFRFFEDNISLKLDWNPGTI